MSKPVLVHTTEGAPLILIHGGWGAIHADKNEPMLLGMKAAVRAGYKILKESGSVVDAVETAVKVLEDDPAFNAGRGSKLNIFGHVEMDASIMEGANMNTGAVASFRGFRNPVAAARVVMENSSHVLVVGEGAERLARKFEVEEVEEDWLITNKSRNQLDEYLKQHNLTHLEQDEIWDSLVLKMQLGSGTVGAVAFMDGHVAAATSTGGSLGSCLGGWGTVHL